MIGNESQIRVIQEGVDRFIFNTIQWPTEIFPNPIVFTVCGLRKTSCFPDLAGYDTITRDQYEWLLHHHDCVVEYRGVSYDKKFFCRNHRCWDSASLTNEVYLDPHLYERVV